MTGTGILPVEPHIYGAWPFNSFPDVVALGGVVFNRARWVFPYSGTIVQYRQAVPTNAMHLLVYRDGSYVITHADEYNPDMGLVLEHAVVDAPMATGLVVGAVGFLTGLVVGLLVLK